MNQMNIENLLESIHKQIPLWDPLIMEPNITYDIQTLYNEIQKKEETDMFSNKVILKSTQDLSDSYGKIPSKLNSTSILDDSFLLEMYDLDLKIENIPLQEYKDYATQWGLPVKALYYYRIGEYPPVQPHLF